MKFLISVILGVFLTLSHASDNIDVDNSGNNGGNINQHVNINNQDQVANVNWFQGWDSWDSVCDYGAGFAATRLYSKKICVVTKMESNFPTLEQLNAVASNQQQAPPVTQMTTYTVDQTPIPNIEEYGTHIEALCRGMPAYTATKMPEFEEGFSLCEAHSIITFLGISFCF